MSRYSRSASILDVVRDRPAVGVVGVGAPEHLRAAVDRGDGGPQLMRDDADERAVEVLRLALLVHPAPALDRAGEEVRDGDEEVRVVDAERPAMGGMDAEDAPRAVATRDGRAHAADDAVLLEHRRILEARLGAQVLDRHRGADLRGRSRPVTRGRRPR